MKKLNIIYSIRKDKNCVRAKKNTNSTIHSEKHLDLDSSRVILYSMTANT